MSGHHYGRAVLAVAVAAFLFGTGGVARALNGFIGTAEQVAAWRVVTGGALMLAVAAARGHAHRIAALWRSPLVWLMGASSLLYQVTFFAGAERIGVGAGTLIAQAVAPVAAGLLTWAVGKGRPTLVWLACTVTAIAGMALITGTGGAYDTTSVLLVGSSGALYSLNVVAGAHIVMSQRGAVSGIDVLTAAFGIGATISLPLAAQGLQWVITPAGLATVAWMGVMATAVGYLLFGYGITHLPAPTVSTLAVSEPVWATLIGVTLLGEVVTLRGWVGCAVIVSSLAAMAWAQSRTPRAVGS